jgi:hypothetical protein
MMQVFHPSLDVDEDVIQICHYKVLVKGRGILSIILINVVGLFVKPKGMSNHSKRCSFDLKEVFHTSVCSIVTWWYPYFRLILLKYLALVS